MPGKCSSLSMASFRAGMEVKIVYLQPYIDWSDSVFGRHFGYYVGDIGVVESISQHSKLIHVRVLGKSGINVYPQQLRPV